MISVRSIAPHEWREYRHVRLRALLDSPDAFGSTYGMEVKRPDDIWSSRINRSISSSTERAFFASNHEEVCGLVWCKLSVSEPGVADIFQMWVAPSSRGLGAGRALLEEAIAWVASVNVHRVRLGVTAADSPAMRLYIGQGFRPVGALEPLREDSNLMVQTMELEL